jgi:DNA repair protein RadC
VDLLAIALSRREADVVQAEEAALRLLRRHHGLGDLAQTALEDLQSETGLDRFEALRWLALLELGRRIGIAGKGPVRTIECSEDVADLLEHLQSEKREHFYSILMDSKGSVLRAVPVHIGTLTMSLVGPREVFREAIREGASSLIVAHNHPSGDPEPSPEDVEVTLRLAEVGELLDIPLLDHVIIGDKRHVSLKGRGIV